MEATISLELGIMALVVALAALVYALVATRKRAWMQHVSTVEAALVRSIAELRIRHDGVEKVLAQIPTTKDFIDLSVGLAELRGKQEAVLVEVHGTRQAVRRVEDFLMKAPRNE